MKKNTIGIKCTTIHEKVGTKILLRICLILFNIIADVSIFGKEIRR